MWTLKTLFVSIAVVVVLSLITTAFYSYRNSVWREGRDAALEAVAKQNEVARNAAQGVRVTIDQCFEKGGDWNVATGTCDTD